MHDKNVELEENTRNFDGHTIKFYVILNFADTEPPCKSEV